MGHISSKFGGEKNWFLALCLSMFLGPVGADRFYLGCILSGIVKLVIPFATFALPPLLNALIPPCFLFLSPILGTVGYLVVLAWWIMDVVMIIMKKTLFFDCGGYYFKPVKSSSKKKKTKGKKGKKKVIIIKKKPPDKK